MAVIRFYYLIRLIDFWRVSSCSRVVKQEEYFFVKETNMPAVLIEVGYLTNPQEEQKMFENEFQRQVAISIVEGIKEYMEIHS